MRYFLCLVLSVLVYITATTSAQAAVRTHHRLNTDVTDSAWHYNEYPNPQTHPGECGRNKRSFVCDPDSILRPGQADELDWLIQEIKNNTGCPCNQSVCSTNKGGFSVSIAMVKKLFRLTEDYSRLLDDARSFVYYLEGQRWNFDRCDEDIIILFSQNDRIVFSITGSKARQQIPDATLHEITMDSQQFFQHNPFMGLKHMIYGIRHALRSHFHVYLDEKRRLARTYSFLRLNRNRRERTGAVYGADDPMSSAADKNLPMSLMIIMCTALLAVITRRR